MAPAPGRTSPVGRAGMVGASDMATGVGAAKMPNSQKVVKNSHSELFYGDFVK